MYHVCMCVCVYVCTYVSNMYVCHVYMCVCMYVCVYVLDVVVAVICWFVWSSRVQGKPRLYPWICPWISNPSTWALGVDERSAVVWQAGVLTSTILSRPSVVLYFLRKLGLAGRRSVGRSLRLRVTLQLRPWGLHEFCAVLFFVSGLPEYLIFYLFLMLHYYCMEFDICSFG